jgi:hypothetical protein
LEIGGSTFFLGLGGLVLGGDGASGRMAISDQAFDGHDHGDGLDLGGHAVAGPFGVHVRDFPEAGQDLVAAHVEPVEFLGILLDELLLNGGTVFKHVGADTRFGFGVGGESETCTTHSKVASDTVKGEVLGIPHLKIEMWGTRRLLEGENPSRH